MAEVVKMRDLQGEVAARVFAMLNPEKVRIKEISVTNSRISIVTDTEPCELIYPEGWYYARGHLTNKYNSSNGFYHTVRMFKSDGSFWNVPYCTAD